MGIQIDADGAGMTASTKTTVERALALIEGGALDRDTVERLAERLGIGARHLSRLCAEHVVRRRCKLLNRFVSSAQTPELSGRQAKTGTRTTEDQPLSPRSPPRCTQRR